MINDMLHCYKWSFFLIFSLVSHFLKGLQIEEHAEKKSSELSGGTKRKLTYALSMLGEPKIVLMDEPRYIFKCK